MYLFNKIVGFLDFLCRVCMVTPDTINAHRARSEPLENEDEAKAVRFRFR